MKTFPKVGDAGYLFQHTGDYYVDQVKRPVTVVEVSKTKIKVQHCKLIYPMFKYDPDTMSDYYKQFDGRRVCFYDTVAESVEPDTEGRIEELTWHPKKEFWGTSGSYPEILNTNCGYQHFPYLN